MNIPPKPIARAEKVSLWRYLRLFRRDILSAQPAKLYRAWMAEFRTPFFRSFLINDPALIKQVLKDVPDDFPKSERIAAGLKPLLGNAVFLTNGEVWKRQRRIIDPAFEGGRLRDTFPAMLAAAHATVARISGGTTDEYQNVEVEASHVAADVIFRTLFSIPIESDVATRVFDAFQKHQRSQPILNLAAFINGPRWMPRLFRRDTLKTANEIRHLIAELVEERACAIKDGSAPNDLATKIMTTCDPETGARFSTEEMADQIAIFFLAGHETSAASLSWTLYLLATYPEWQEKVAKEASHFNGGFSDLSQLKVTRDVFRESLRLYPPVPMMVREAAKTKIFRSRNVKAGAQVVLSPWHLHRHERLWDNADAFDPARWQTESGKKSARDAFIPFSSGPRACTGAGFAMMEGVLLTAMIVSAFRIEADPDRRPVPTAQLTVRSQNGIWLRFFSRD